MLPLPLRCNREHSPFVTLTIDVATGWLFEDGYAKESARYFQTAGNSFRTMLKKLPCRCMLNIRTNGECSRAISTGMNSTSESPVSFHNRHFRRPGYA